MLSRQHVCGRSHAPQTVYQVHAEVLGPDLRNDLRRVRAKLASGTPQCGLGSQQKLGQSIGAHRGDYIPSRQNRLDPDATLDALDENLPRQTRRRCNRPGRIAAD